MKKEKPEQGAWAPRFTLDIHQANQSALDDLMAEFKKAAKERGNNRPSLAEVGFREGWNMVTPAMAEEALLRNVANRRPLIETVRYYGRQMVQDLWMPTGQPCIFNTEENFDDGQNRMLACYVTGKPFKTFIVTTTEPIPNIFAYIDNSKPRTPAVALQTAGFNGLSSAIIKAIDLIRLYDANAFTLKKYTVDKKKAPKLAPVEYLQWASQHTDIKTIVHGAISNHSDAIEVIGERDVVTFLAWKIEKLYEDGELIAEEFLSEVGDTDTERSDGDPVKALQAKMRANQAKTRTKDLLSTHQILAYCIKAFNFWRTGQKLKVLKLDVAEAMPVFVAEAATSATNEDEEAA